MSFQSLSFLAFLAVTLGVCLPLGRRNLRWGQAALTLFCLVFYVLGGGWAALLVLLAGAVVTVAAVRYLTSGGKTEKQRRAAAAVAIVWHVAVLLVFKYTGFFTGGAVDLGWAPLGLSFFTFQQIWCIKEVYTGAFRPESTGSFLLYDFFFPSVTSGPILKPENFFPQLTEGRFLHPTWEDAAAGVYAIAVGTIKKVLLADPFGVVVNNGWAQLGDLSAPAAWLVILGYTLQLYFDFSGYCDIAAGLARLLGLRLPVNFDSPYRSLSVGEFWKRWHITLTSFLRECVYFPLGGSRKGTVCTYRNIFAIYLISGFWHGAGWTFIVWGLLHGLGQVIERIWGPGRDPVAAVGRDVPVCQCGLGIFPGAGLLRGIGTAGPCGERRPCQARGVALIGAFLQGDRRGGAADPRCCRLGEHPPGDRAVRHRAAGGSVAPEHHHPDGPLPSHLVAGSGAGDRADLVHFVLHRHHHLYLFQFLRRPR